MLVSGSNIFGCPNNIVTTVAVVSQNIWPTQILAIMEVSAVVGFVIGGRAPFCSLFFYRCSLLLSSFINSSFLHFFISFSLFLSRLLVSSCPVPLCAPFIVFLHCCLLLQFCNINKPTVRSEIQERCSEISSYLCVSGTGQSDCGNCNSWTGPVCSPPS